MMLSIYATAKVRQGIYIFRRRYKYIVRQLGTQYL